MPRRKTDKYWRERVLSHVANNERISDRRIWQLLEKEAESLKRECDADRRLLAEGYPSERTIGRIRKEEWPNMTESGRAQYRRFYWPESMERGDLPWEASKVALEFVGTIAKSGVSERLSVGAVKWFWRVTQAAPDAPLVNRMESAVVLMVTQGEQDRDELIRGIEFYLAYRPWIYGEAEEFKVGLLRESPPLPKFPALNFDLGRISLEAFELLMAVDAFKEGLNSSLESNND